MAEYIEREALIAEIQKNINTYWNEGSGGYYIAEDALNYSVKTAPTADVVPKSEVERLQEEIETLKDNNEHLAVLLTEAKQEVAKEIFEEIESIFIDGCDYYHTMEIGDYAKLKKKYPGEKECPQCKHFAGCEPSTLGICDEYEEEEL